MLRRSWERKLKRAVVEAVDQSNNSTKSQLIKTSNNLDTSSSIRILTSSSRDNIVTSKSVRKHVSPSTDDLSIQKRSEHVMPNRQTYSTSKKSTLPKWKP